MTIPTQTDETDQTNQIGLARPLLYWL